MPAQLARVVFAMWMRIFDIHYNIQITQSVFVRKEISTKSYDEMSDNLLQCIHRFIRKMLKTIRKSTKAILTSKIWRIFDPRINDVYILMMKEE